MNRQGNRVGMRRATTQRKPLFAAVVGALALLAAGQGMAQEQQPAQDSTEKSAVTLDRIVVTANKRVENVREVGASISVIGEQQLENLSANSLSDYADYVPGLQVQDRADAGVDTRHLGAVIRRVRGDLHRRSARGIQRPVPGCRDTQPRPASL
jgi:outer membrane receptor for ferrienterochelin and colicin